MWFNGRFFVSLKEIKDGAVPVEGVLDEKSLNPLQNRAVAAAIRKLESAFNIVERVNLLNPAEINVFAESVGGIPKVLAETGYVSVAAGETYTYQCTGKETGERYCSDAYTCTFFDYKQEIIATVDNDECCVVAPENAVYAKFLLKDYDITNERAIVKGDTVVEFEPYIENTYIIKADDRLDKTSTNAVQNKVVFELNENIGNLNDRLTAMEKNGHKNAVLCTPQILTEEQKAQARENVGAVAEDETFDRAEGETIVGKNLLNVNAPMPDPDDVYSGGFLRGKLFNDEGVISGSSAACITDYIPVQDGKYIVCSHNNGTKRAYMMARRTMGYDADKNLIGLLSSSTNYITPAKLAGVAYVRLQVTTSYVDAEGQVEYSDKETFTAYEPYTETVVEGGLTLKPGCMPAEFAELTEQMDELSAEVDTIKNAGGSAVAEDVTLAIDKARFDGQFNYVAYSDINGIGKDQNSREFFAWASKQEFTALKGDIEITADGKIVMCHDKGFTLNDEGKIVVPYDSTNSTLIHDMTEAECLALQYARYGKSVCGFEEYIRICKKYGKIAYITVRNHYVDEYVPELLRVLRKYGMVKQCIISAYPEIAPLYAVRAAEPNIMMAWVLGKYEDVTTAHIDTAISLGNMLISGFHLASASDDVDARLAGSVAAIEYAHEHDIRVYDGQVHTMEQADKLMEYGITGAQIRFKPSFLNAVLYTKQTLTDDEKAQARANIGVN